MTMVATDFNYFIESKTQTSYDTVMKIQEKQKPPSAGAINVASLIQNLQKVGIKSDEIKNLLRGEKENPFTDSQLTKLRNPSRYPSVFSDETLEGYYKNLMSKFEKRLDSVETPYQLLRGWYKVFTYTSKIVSHIVKIDVNQNSELCMYWDYDVQTKNFASHGLVKVKGPQLFIELNPSYKLHGSDDNVPDNRSRFLILHSGLFQKQQHNAKQCYTGVITRLRANNNEIISYSCLFVKLDELLSERSVKTAISYRTSLDVVLKELKSSGLDESLYNYSKTYFDPRRFRDIEKKNCVIVKPLDNYLLSDISKQDYYLKERTENEKLTGLYMMVCNLPPANLNEHIRQKRNIGFVFFEEDSSVMIKTDNYSYRGSFIIYPGTNILEIRAEAFVSDNKFDELQLKTEREFSILITASLGDNRYQDFQWLSCVSVGVSENNIPIAMSERLIRMDKYFIEQKTDDEDPLSKEAMFKKQLGFFGSLKKDYFKTEEGKKLTDDVLKMYGIEDVDLMLNYIESDRAFDVPVERSGYRYQVNLDAFYGGVYKLENAFSKRGKGSSTNMITIDYEAQILFSTLSNFKELYKHGFRYDLLDNSEKGIFDDVFYKISNKNSSLNSYLSSYFAEGSVDVIKNPAFTDVAKVINGFPSDKDVCKIRLLEMYFLSMKK